MPPTRRTPMPTHDAPAGQAPECQFCPLCQAMAALRSARPTPVWSATTKQSRSCGVRISSTT